jgi:polyisoprenoid-binding protein YceI
METLTATKTTTWNIDTVHSHIAFNVRHMVVSKAKGDFKSYSATITTEGNDLTTAKIKFEAETASIDTDKPDRDGHLKSDDFFNAEKYPKLTFESGRITKIDEHNYKMEGNLTIRDITKPITLDVEAGGIIKDPYGLERAGYHVTGKINRIEYGLKWNSTIEAGGVVLSEIVNIDCDIELTKAQ